jgi:hypothetical protein
VPNKPFPAPTFQYIPVTLAGSCSFGDITPADSGAHNRIRTGDLFLTKEVLYRLSYMSYIAACYLSRRTCRHSIRYCQPSTRTLSCSDLTLRPPFIAHRRIWSG